jgi:hypothetical protein
MFAHQIISVPMPNAFFLVSAVRKLSTTPAAIKHLLYLLVVLY